MHLLCLGGAEKICREAVLDLVAFSDFERITIADIDPQAGEALAASIGDEGVDLRLVDVRQKEATVAVIQDYDIVMDGTTIHLNDQSTVCIAYEYDPDLADLNAQLFLVQLDGFTPTYYFYCE